MKRGLVLYVVIVMLALLSPSAGPAQEPDRLVARGGRAFTSQGCYGCHLIGKYGTPIGPDLSHVGGKYSAAYLTTWLKDPESVRPSAHMPKLELTAEDIQGLAAYLGSLK
jgi:cytochrome c oxidase subunit 2